MISPLKFALGLVLFLITIVVGEMVMFGNGVQVDTRDYGKLSRFTHLISDELVIVAVFTISLAIVFFVPAIEGEIFVEWATLGLPNVARLVAAFGLNFFPGYLILAISGRHELGKLPKLIISYFLSLFVLFITGFVSAHIMGIVDEFFLNTFLFVCATLIVVYLSKRLLRQKSRLENPKNSGSSSIGFRNTLPNLLVVLTVAFIAIFLWWLYSNVGFFIGSRGSDMWRFHGFAQAFLDYKAFNWLHVFWAFPLYLAGFAVLSGVPSVNAYLALFPLIALPVLSFYCMASSFLKDRKMSSLAAMSYFIFSGPAWIYALFLRDFSSVISYDIWIPILFETGEKFLFQGRYPPFALGLNAATLSIASLWLMLYATWQLDLKRRFDFFLISTTFVMSYLLHGVDVIIFMVYLFAVLLVFVCTQNIKGKKRVRRATAAILMGLGIVSLIDISLTTQYDYFNSTNSSLALSSRWEYFNSPSFYAIVFASALLIVLTYSEFIDKKFRQLYSLVYKRLAPKYVGSLKKYFVEIMFNLYAISLIVFVVFFSSLSITEMYTGWVPSYVYPAVGGVPFFFGVVGVAIVLLKRKASESTVRNIVFFCALSIGLLFILGKITSFINQEFFYTRFWERRILVYIHPVISMLMAYALVTLFGRIHKKLPLSLKRLVKIGTVSVLTSLLILSSVSSTLMAGDFAFRIFFAASPTAEELEALNYLHYSLPKGFKAAYLSQQTGLDYIRCFANDKFTYDPYQWWGQSYFSPGSVLFAIDSLNIQFLYLNHIRDAKDLEENLFIEQLIGVLPVEFRNSEVTIYSIPPLHGPSLFSPLGVISPKETEVESYSAYVLWFFALLMGDSPYQIISDTSDPIAFDAVETVIIPNDPLPIEEEVKQLSDWVSEGGNLVVSNTNLHGTFSDMFGLMPKFSLMDGDSTENWTTLHKRGTISLENSSKTEGAASLRMQNNMSSWEQWEYTPPVSWNLSRHEYLGIWVYGTGGGPQWYLYLEDSNGNENHYRYDLSVFDYATRTYVPEFTGWKLHLIPIQKYYGGLDLSAIRKLRIVTGSQLPVDMLIDDVFLMKETEEHPIVLADGIQGLTTIDLPDIGIESLSQSLGSDVRVMANYTWEGESVTPFIIQKDFGNGKVTYVNINLLFQSIISKSDGISSPHEVLAKILVILGVSA